MLNKIHFFQIDNLIKNRVPFVLLNLGPSLISLYSSIYKNHLQSHEVLTSKERALVYLTDQKIPKDAAVLVICQNGVESLKLFNELQKNLYTNVYLIDGGYQQLMTERSEA